MLTGKRLFREIMKGLIFMIVNNEYFQVLDELRKLKNVSVSELCEGIISERTYYRIINKNTILKLSIFMKLLKKLNISLVQFSNFLESKYNLGFNINQFIYLVHTQNYQNIEKYYQFAKENCTSKSMYDLMVKAYVKKYEYLQNMISKNEYISLLTQIINDFPNKSIYQIAVFCLFIESNVDVDTRLIQDVAMQILNVDFSLSLLLAIISLDTFIYTIIDKDTLSLSVKSKLIEKFLFYASFIPNKEIELKSYFYKAYLNKLNNQSIEDNLLCYLYKIFSYSDLEKYRNEKTKIEKIFNIDLIEFIKTKSQKIIK